MSETNYLKCQCQQCGGHIEFPCNHTGSLVKCPHCGWLTQLTAPPSPSAAPVAPKNNATTKKTIAALVAFGVLFAGATLLVQKKSAAPKLSPTQAGSIVARTNLSPQLPSPVMTNLSTNQFEISNIKLEKAKEGSLVYVTGSVRNEADRPRFGVRIELELFDTAGTKLGTASDYQGTLAPKSVWHFKALVLSSKAATAKLASIKED